MQELFSAKKQQWSNLIPAPMRGDLHTVDQLMLKKEFSAFGCFFALTALIFLTAHPYAR